MDRGPHRAGLDSPALGYQVYSAGQGLVDWVRSLSRVHRFTAVNVVDLGRGFGIVPVFIPPNRLSSGQNSSSCLLRWNLLASVSTKLMLRLLQHGPSEAEMRAKSGCTGVLRAFPVVDAFLGIRLKLALP